MKISLRILPNPSNNELLAEYFLPISSHIKITLFDAIGNQVKEFVNGTVDSGFHTLKIETSSLSSGYYILNLECNGKIISEKIIINK